MNPTYRRRKRRSSRGRNRRSRRNNDGRRRLFGMAAWTASFLMIVNMLPAESSFSQILQACEESLPAMSLDLEELRRGPQTQDEGSALTEEASAPVQEAPSVKLVVSDAPQEPAQEAGAAESEAAEKTAEKPEIITSLAQKQETVEKTVPVSSATGSGDILIYHTHATEAYAPVASASSTHAQAPEGTVREAGASLSAALTAKGYHVIHDGTMHDSPSYNKSYNRSLETLKGLLANYPSPKLVIDFHRDAASSASGKPRTVSIGGETVSSFALVVGTKNDNCGKLRSLAEKISQKANAMYPGFCTGIIEKPYKFNGYLTDQFILLEFGNNANTIEQVRGAVPYLSDVIAAAVG